MKSVFSYVLSEETQRDLEAINNVGRVICDAMQSSSEAETLCASDFFFAAALVILARRSCTAAAPAPAEKSALVKERERLDALNNTLLESIQYFRYALAAYGASDVRQLCDDMQSHWPQPTPEPSVVEVIRSKIDELMPSSTTTTTTTFPSASEAEASASATPATAASSLAPVAPNADAIDAPNRAFADALALALTVSRADIIAAQAEAERLLPAHLVLIDRSRNELIVAVRGTHHINDIVTDALMMTSESAKFGKVHRGIAEATEQLLARLVPVIQSTLAKEPSIKRVVCTGHSLGAGCASLLSLELRDANLGVDVACYAFAPPPFLSDTVAKSAKSHVHTFVCGDDFIPRASARGLVGLHRGLSLILDRVGRDADAQPVRRLMRLAALINVAERDCALGPDVVVRSLEKLADCRIEDLAFDPKLLDDMDKTVLECERSVTSDSDVFTRFHLAGQIFHLERSSENSFAPRLLEPVGASTTLHSRLAEAMLSDHLAGAYARALKSTQELVQAELRLSGGQTQS